MNENASDFAPVLNAALRHALEHVAPHENSPIAPTVAIDDLRRRLDLPLGDFGLDPVQVLEELVAATRDGLSRTTSGRFFGWVIGGALPAALAADWMTCAWDQNAAMYAASPAASVVEETAGRWLKEVLRLPSTASFGFVTGCQMAHVTCLAVARHAVLNARGWDVRQNGLAGAPAIRILTSTEQHSTIVRAVRLLGLGERHIEQLPADADGRLIAVDLLAALLRVPERPAIVVLQAGDVNIGAFDDFATSSLWRKASARGCISTARSVSGQRQARTTATCWQARS